jgi:hypothetical protein
VQIRKLLFVICLSLDVNNVIFKVLSWRLGFVCPMKVNMLIRESKDCQGMSIFLGGWGNSTLELLFKVKNKLVCMFL